jgi:tRNA A37 threonylcarbamoyladenosine synthetase subunit TsaC/SUA5/YrdC
VAAAVDGTLAVRIPDHAMLRALLYRVGPLTATSANRHGRPPSTRVDDALESLVDVPDLVLDGGVLAGGSVSTMVDLTGDETVVLRRGAVAWEQRFDLETETIDDLEC